MKKYNVCLKALFCVVLLFGVINLNGQKNYEIDFSVGNNPFAGVVPLFNLGITTKLNSTFKYNVELGYSKRETFNYYRTKLEIDYCLYKISFLKLYFGMGLTYEVVPSMQLWQPLESFGYIIPLEFEFKLNEKYSLQSSVGYGSFFSKKSIFGGAADNSLPLRLEFGVSRTLVK